MEQFT